jgi:DNA-binding response OmpR family regulator
MEYRVLLVEDEKEISDLLKLYLRESGYSVTTCSSGIEAIKLFYENKPHFVILDIMLDDISGLEVLEEIRSQSNIPVLMLTALNDERSRLKGFGYGADDYVCKPFSPKEVISRVNVIIKRSYENTKESEYIFYHDLELNVTSRTLHRLDESIEITNREFEILHLLMKNPGRIYSRDEIIDFAFQNNYEGYDRSIDAFIKKLRLKLGEKSNEQYIHTKYGMGYSFGKENK